METIEVPTDLLKSFLEEVKYYNDGCGCCSHSNVSDMEEYKAIDSILDLKDKEINKKPEKPFNFDKISLLESYGRPEHMWIYRPKGECIGEGMEVKKEVIEKLLLDWYEENF